MSSASTSGASEARVRLGPIGIWVGLDGRSADEAVRYARLVDELGYGALWVPESVGREPFALLGTLAQATRRLTLGLGIASIYARDAVAAHAGARTLADLSGTRVVMGLGVSHPSSAQQRGHAYRPPIEAMTTYLEEYTAAPWAGPPAVDPPLVIAALGPRMLRLAAARTAGAFGYLVTVGHVASAREILDRTAESERLTERPVLVAAQLAIAGTGPEARRVARAAIERHLAQPAYRANLVRAGIAVREIDAVTESVVDALVAIGDVAMIRERIAAMHAAGADHVAVIPLSGDGRHGDVPLTRALAPG